MPGPEPHALLLTQYQAPVTGLPDQICSARSTAALSAMGRLKLIMMGMPTPTVSPAPRIVAAEKLRRGRSVRKSLDMTVRRPAVSTAVAVTW